MGAFYIWNQRIGFTDFFFFLVLRKSVDCTALNLTAIWNNWWVLQTKLNISARKSLCWPFRDRNDPSGNSDILNSNICLALSLWGILSWHLCPGWDLGMGRPQARSCSWRFWNKWEGIHLHAADNELSEAFLASAEGQLSRDPPAALGNAGRQKKSTALSNQLNP